MFVVTVSFEIHADHIADFLPRMIENAQTSFETEPGCHQFDVCQDGNTVFLYEVYEDRAAFDTHLATDHFLEFDRSVAPMVASKDIQTFTRVLP